MIEIEIPSAEFFDEGTAQFITYDRIILRLEHSLISLSKWESKWNKPFLDEKEKTQEECIDYVRCMTLTKNVNPFVYERLTTENFRKINAYIEASMTATWFTESKTKGRHMEVVTAEVIYYWMISLNVPFECQTWHLNRLLTLIRVCNEKNAPQKKMSRKDIYSRNRNLNNARRKANHSKG